MDFVGKEFGNSKDEMHDFFKWEFLRQDVRLDGLNRTVTVIRDTKDLTTKEFAEYVDSIIVWCANEGIIVPEASTDVFNS